MHRFWNATQTAGGALLVAAALVTAYLAVVAIPEVARYRRIRRM